MRPRVVAMLIVMTLAAGYADVVAFLALGSFTANMTGNTVLLGAAIAGRFVPQLAGRIGWEAPALSLACFAAGVACAVALLRLADRERVAWLDASVLGAVALLVAAAAATQRWGGAELRMLDVALLSLAMGAQSVVAVRAGVPGVTTTFVTGTILHAVSEFESGPRERAEGLANAAVWASYLAGAIAGAFALHALGSNALWLTALAMACLLPIRAFRT